MILRTQILQNAKSLVFVLSYRQDANRDLIVSRRLKDGLKSNMRLSQAMDITPALLHSSHNSMVLIGES